MPRKKQKPLGFWQTAEPDNLEKSVIIKGRSLLRSEQYKALKPAARCVYDELILQYGLARAKNKTIRHELQGPALSDFFKVTQSDLVDNTGISRCSVIRALQELEAAHFIVIWHGQSRKVASQYAFSLNWRRTQCEGEGGRCQCPDGRPDKARAVHSGTAAAAAAAARIEHQHSRKPGQAISN